MATAAGVKKAGGVPLGLSDFCNWRRPESVEDEATLEGTFMLMQSLAGPQRG